MENKTKYVVNNSYISVNLGVLLQTADDTDGLSGRVLRDGDVNTCMIIPQTDNPQKYLRARMAWPIVDNVNPNYSVTITGKNLQCDFDHTLVYIKVSATWGGSIV